MLRLMHADVLNDVNTSVSTEHKSLTTLSPRLQAVEAESVYTQEEQRGGA